MSPPAKVVAPAVAAITVVAHASLFASTMVDDAWISFRYGRNLAEGLGLVFNPGDVPVEGYTNFAWVMLAALAHAIGLPVEGTAKVVGALCAAAVAGLVAHHAPRLYQDPPPWAGWLAGLTVAISTSVATYAVTGLETLLYTLLMLVAVLGLIERKPVLFGAFTALAFLTRPEAALLGVVGVALFFLRKRREAVRAVSVLAAVVLPYLAFKQLTFGSIVPNTLEAKGGSLLDGAEYLLDTLWPLGGLVLAAALGAREGVHAQVRELAIYWLVFAIAVSFVGGDWMPAGRMLVPMLPWLALAAEPTISGWLGTLRGWGGAAGRERVLAVLGVALLVPYAGYQVALSHSFWVSVEPWHEVADARRALAERWQRDGVASVALVDIGLPGWVAPELEIIDFGGLTDPSIARTAQGHLTARPDPDYLELRRPEIVVLTSAADTDGADASGFGYEPQFEVERTVLQSRWLADHHRYVETVIGSDSYRMHLYVREPRSEVGQDLR